jgi:acyl-CoA thioesterase I
MGKRRRRNSRDSFWAQQYGGMPVWALSASLVAIIVFGAVAIGGITRVDSTSSAAESTPRPIPTFSTGQEVTAPTAISVVGDSFTGGSGMDSGKAARWTTLVDDEFAVTTYHEGGTGYAATLETADGPSNFVTRVEGMPTEGIDNLVFFGSINDGQEGYDATFTAATAALTEAKSKWPNADILVIGPASPRWPVPAEFEIARDATRDAAAAASLDFVDPIELGWFENRDGLIGADNTHPNDEGHAYLAEQLRPVLKDHFAG